jgi:hypothetical protein
MQIFEILQAIKMQVKSTHSNKKVFYGKGGRVFVFMDNYENEMGSFIVNEMGDVCEIIVTNRFEKPNESPVGYKWISKKYKEKRDIALTRIGKSEYLKEVFISGNIKYKDIKDEYLILKIVQSTCEGTSINEKDVYSIENIQLNINEKALQVLAKMSLEKDESVKDIICSFMKEGKSIDDINNMGNNLDKEDMVVGSKDSKKIVELKNIEKKEVDMKEVIQLRDSIKDLSLINSMSGQRSAKLDLNKELLSERESKNVKLPDFINGDFKIGKGFQRKKILPMIGTKIDLPENLKLKDRVAPTVENKEQLIAGIMHTYAGDKVVLSNMKLKTSPRRTI